MLSGPTASATVSSEQLLDRFLSGSPRQRRNLLPQIEQRSAALRPLLAGALGRLDPQGDDWAAGQIVQWLLQDDDEHRGAFLEGHPHGWLHTPSRQGIDHAPLQEALARQAFEQADRITSETLRHLAGPGAVQRGYVYYSEVPAISDVDLATLDRLWVCYSRARFGFSVQARLLQVCEGRWERLWPRLGWKREGVWTRYPAAFTWSLEAPEGHMPLINQLRGVRLMDAVLRHPAVQERIPQG